ncbi:hypothetical protein TL18_00400 [Methanobrevibacter sp. YE315]|uniref:DsbA family oxidoreductase n=1 Tax=Methanobrevibacter sp. YE315 TaxID=1609968 RepID=UPI000764D8EB|nr:DsbA family protein [Methanobrevibacter sp. YE315]AMD16631.1 hypothetical protein TL18_00400 [Methanobrevibacter sp. YE315]
MKILYLSDFNCPYSYIGLNRIKNVCDELDLDAEWEMRSFELEPDSNNVPAVERHAIKNGLSLNDARREIEDLEKIAKAEGLNINYRDMVINSSKDAHRLVKYVQDKYPQIALELVFKIFEYNFIRNENIANHDVLKKIASSCGLDENEIREFLEKDSLKIEVYLDMDEALSNGITTIPYYFLYYKNERLIIPGVFEKEYFKTAFKDLLSGEIRNKTFI